MHRKAIQGILKCRAGWVRDSWKSPSFPVKVIVICSLVSATDLFSSKKVLGSSSTNSLSEENSDHQSSFIEDIKAAYDQLKASSGIKVGPIGNDISPYVGKYFRIGASSLDARDFLKASGFKVSVTSSVYKIGVTACEADCVILGTLTLNNNKWQMVEVTIVIYPKDGDVSKSISAFSAEINVAIL